MWCLLVRDCVAGEMCTCAVRNAGRREVWRWDWCRVRLDIDLVEALLATVVDIPDVEEEVVSDRGRSWIRDAIAVMGLDDIVVVYFSLEQLLYLLFVRGSCLQDISGGCRRRYRERFRRNFDIQNADISCR